MRQLIETAAGVDPAEALVPPPGITRRLKRNESPEFRYPRGTTPAPGPVFITHLASGGIEVRVLPGTNPRLTGRTAELFRRGVLVFATPAELTTFLIDDLSAQWADGVREQDSVPPAPTHPAPAPHRLPVDLAAVTALREQASLPTAAVLHESIRRRVVGQEEAIGRLATGVARHLRKSRPTAPYSALLIGPTGVGKTESVLALADALASAQPDNNWSQVVIDCGELTGPDQLNRILGAAPGYVGFDQGSPIADALSAGPAILVFDEIEKAHPSLFQRVLLGLLDRGRFSSPNPGPGESRTMDASDGIVLFTSNLGVEALRANSAPDELRHFLRTHGLRPELVGRLRDVVQLGELSGDDVAAAACLATEAILAEYGLRVGSIDPSFLAQCLDAHDMRAGVRGVRVTVEERITPVLERLLDSGYRGSVDIGTDPGTPLRPTPAPVR